MMRPSKKNNRQKSYDLPSNRHFLCLVASVLLMLLCVGCSAKNPGRMIFHGGDIVTMSDKPLRSAVDAVFVENGIIVATGEKDEILKRKTNDTRIIDLEGKTLMPGFIAVHTHPDLSAYLHGYVDLSGFTNRTKEDVWAKLRQAVAQTPKGHWIFCRGFDPMLVAGLTAPDIDFLDAMAPDHPVLILAQSIHSAWANSLAFKKMGVTASTPDPAPGSYFEKDGKGNLTGFIVETAAVKVMSEDVLKVFDIKDNILKINNEYLGNGFTSITTLGLMNGKTLILYEYLSTAHPKLLSRALDAAGLLPSKKPTVRHFMYLLHSTPDLFPKKVENGDDFFKICGMKIWYDGSPYTGSMYIREPYLNSELMLKGLKIPANHRGQTVIGRQDFFNAVKNYHELGWQVSVHSQGDRSTEEVLEVFEKIQSESKVKHLRHRIEHGVLLPPELLEKMKHLGITPSFHINHLYYYGKALRDDILGAERAAKMLPVGSTGKAGIMYSLHADAPMYPEEPFSLLQTAVSRKTREGEILGSHEAIPVLDGLKALTVYAAWQINMEKKIGSIEPGKYADLIILDQNPLKVNPGSLREIRVLNTFVSGNEVWRRER